MKGGTIVQMKLPGSEKQYWQKTSMFCSYCGGNNVWWLMGPDRTEPGDHRSSLHLCGSCQSPFYTQKGAYREPDDDARAILLKAIEHDSAPDAVTLDEGMMITLSDLAFESGANYTATAYSSDGPVFYKLKETT